MESANKMGIPLTVCKFCSHFEGSAYSCGYLNSSVLPYICFIICLWIPQTVPDYAKTVADSASSPVFEAILSGSVLVICLWNPKQQERFLKTERLRSPRQI